MISVAIFLQVLTATSAAISYWWFYALEVVLVLVGIRSLVPSRQDRMRNKLRRANTFEQWNQLAKELDVAEGYAVWKTQTMGTRLYNSGEVSSRIRRLILMKETSDFNGFLEMLQSDFHRVSCGLTSDPLYKYLTGTKEPIETYISLLCDMFQKVPSSPSMKAVEKICALQHVGRAYGRSALVLNSSVALGAYHLGVVKTLHENNLLPNIIFGVNTGAIAAAVMCTRDNIEDVYKVTNVDFSSFKKRSQKGSLRRKVNRLWEEGTFMDVAVMSQFVEDNLGDITFIEAFEKTGRVLNIQVEQQNGGDAAKRTTGRSSWLLNYLTAPHVLIRTAAVASCATWGFYGFLPLKARAMDGSIVPYDVTAFNVSADVLSEVFHVNTAVQRMREMFDINCFIVSDATLQHTPLIRLRQREGVLPQLLHFLMEEVWRLLAAVSRIPFLRTRLTGQLQIMNSPVVGDVIINPITKWRDLLKLALSNPDTTLLSYCILRGEQATWPKLPVLRTHVAVEQALAKCIHQLKEDVDSDDYRRACLGIIECRLSRDGQ